MVKLLIERGANVESKDAAGETPLHFAVANGRAKCVAELLRSGADAWAHKNAQGKVEKKRKGSFFFFFFFFFFVVVVVVVVFPLKHFFV